MFIDASAIVGILNDESDARQLERKLDAATTPLSVSPLAIFEAVMAIARERSAKGARRVDADFIARAEAGVLAFVEDIGAREIPITADIGRMAIQAAGRYGKTIGHKAGLNFGDCFAYACAKAQGAPLLFKGDDFSRTDMA
jgi:ribonuclease VapC